jgi:Mrp family chromosome partitioning ATPase
MVAAIVVVAAGGAYAITSLRHKMIAPTRYLSTTEVLIQVDDPASVVGSSGGSVFAEPPTGQQMSDQSQLLPDAANKRAVSLLLHIPLASASGVTVAPLTQGIAEDEGSSILVVSTTGSSPLLAQRLANAYASVYLASRKTIYANYATSQAATLASELAGIPNVPSNSTTRQSLTLDIDTLRAQASNPNAEAYQVSPAPLGSAVAVSPPRSPAVYAAIAGVLGLLIGIGVAFGLSLFDRRLTRVSQIESSYGREVLAVLPHVSNASPLLDGHAVIPPALLEAMRALRIGVRLGGGEHAPRTLLVTSAMPGEGKSTLARNLALVFAEGGERVLLIDADLRRPSVPETLGIESKYGLSHVLAGSVSPGQAVVSVIAPEPSRNGRNHKNGAAGWPAVVVNRGSLDVLTHGDTPENPVALLASETMTSVLSSAREYYDVIIVDSAPILAVTDTLPLLGLVDAVLLVSRLGVATRDAARRLADALGRLPGIRVLGVVANDLRGTFLDSDGYGGMYSGRYGGYGYRGGSPEVTTPAEPVERVAAWSWRRDA